MAINETIVTGKKYRQCIDAEASPKRWKRFSFWTHADDVEFEDGQTAQDKLGAFKGITVNPEAGTGYAADVTLLKSVKSALTQQIADSGAAAVNTARKYTDDTFTARIGDLSFFVQDQTIWVKAGADAVPKKLGAAEIPMWLRCWEQKTDAHASAEQIIYNTDRQFEYLKLKTLTLTGKQYDDGYGNLSQVPRGTLIISAGKGGTELFRSQLECRDQVGDSSSGSRTTDFGEKLISIESCDSVYIELELRVGYNINTLDLDYVLL